MAETGVQALLSERVLIEEKNLARHLEWIGRHDTKSSVVLGLDTGMLGFLASVAPRPHAWTTLMVVFAVTSITLLALSLLFLHLGNYPKTRGPQSLLFFGALAALSFEQYRVARAALSQKDYLEDLLLQSHVVARIVSRKF